MHRDKPERNPNHADGFVSDVHATILASGGGVYGLRAFNLTDTGALTGITYPHEWQPGVNTAQCFNPTRDPEFRKMRDDAKRTFHAVTYGGWPMSYYRALHPQDAIEPGPDDRSHDMKACSCGFWAFHEPQRAIGYVHTHRAAGIVRLTGRAVPGTAGWRGVHAEIVALAKPWGWLPTRWQPIVDRFAVPSFMTTLDMLEMYELTKPDPWMLPSEEGR